MVKKEKTEAVAPVAINIHQVDITRLPHPKEKDRKKIEKLVQDNR